MDPSDKVDVVAVERQEVSPLTLFMIKALTVGIVAIVSAWIITGIFISAVGQLLDHRMQAIEHRIQAMVPKRIGGTGFWTIMERELARAAAKDADLSPERKQKIISDLRVISDKWRPFLIEASSVVMDTSASPPATRK
jgi:hypothetical protein